MNHLLSNLVDKLHSKSYKELYFANKRVLFNLIIVITIHQKYFTFIPIHISNQVNHIQNIIAK